MYMFTHTVGNKNRWADSGDRYQQSFVKYGLFTEKCKLIY